MVLYQQLIHADLLKLNDWCMMEVFHIYLNIGLFDLSYTHVHSFCVAACIEKGMNMWQDMWVCWVLWMQWFFMHSKCCFFWGPGWLFAAGDMEQRILTKICPADSVMKRTSDSSGKVKIDVHHSSGDESFTRKFDRVADCLKWLAQLKYKKKGMDEVSWPQESVLP